MTKVAIPIILVEYLSNTVSESLAPIAQKPFGCINKFGGFNRSLVLLLVNWTCS